MDIGINRLSNIPLVIVEFIIVVIKVVIMVEVDIGIKIPATPTIEIVEQELILTGEVDIGIRTATLNTITQVDVLDCWVYLLLIVLLAKKYMKMRE